MKGFQWLLVCLMMFMSLDGHANDDDKQPLPPKIQTSDIMLSTIDRLFEDGYLSEKNAARAKQQYVFDNLDIHSLEHPPPTLDTQASWFEYVSFLGTIKIIAVTLILVGFRGVISTLSKRLLSVMVAVPAVIYQITILALSLTLTYNPTIVWAEESFYLALFGSIVNLMVLSWVVQRHRNAHKTCQTIRLRTASVCDRWRLYHGVFRYISPDVSIEYLWPICGSGLCR